jgi:hypothetical protein
MKNKKVKRVGVKRVGGGALTNKEYDMLVGKKGLNVEKAGTMFDELLASKKLGIGSGQLTEAEIKRILKNSK